MSTATTTAPKIPHAQGITAWFPDFLRKELAPYPGRAGLVARITISATITAVLIALFRIPGGSIAVLIAIALSREDILSAMNFAALRFAAFALAALFIPIGGRLFAAEPVTHVLWEGFSVFLCFYLLRTLANFTLAINFCLVVTNILAIWYLPGPAEQNVQNTLWQLGAATVGTAVTLAVEIIFHASRQRDEVLSGIDERLKQMEDLMHAYAADDTLPQETVREISRYAVVGMGGLRRHTARTADEPRKRQRLSTLVSLTGRSIDFAAALANSTPELMLADRPRALRLAQHIAEIRRCLSSMGQSGAEPAEWEPDSGADATPLMNELEAMMSLIPSVMSSDASLDPRYEILDPPTESSRFFVRDAFVNPDHLRFALSGTLAAMLCYILYVGLHWPALSTSVTTCVLTGLSNIGSSRQKQILRVAGAIFGGFVLGMGSQVFVLPYIDTIGGFTVLCAIVIAICAWVLTSSARLSYAGLQAALAFFLITMTETGKQLSLSVARDRVLGVLLGIFMMWLVFERFFPRPASGEMASIFIRNMRLLADLIETTVIDAKPADILRIRRQRDRIFRNFGEVNAQMDAIPFETGPQRAAHMAARDRIRRWQASLRTFYLLQAPLLQFRIFADSAERGHAFYHLEDEFRQTCGHLFRAIATSLEAQVSAEAGKPMAWPAAQTDALKVRLVPLLDSMMREFEGEFTVREHALFRMARTLGSVVDRLAREVDAEPLFVTE